MLPALGKSKKTSFPVSAGSPNSPASLMPYTPRRMSKSMASIFFSVRNTFAIETLMMLTSSFSFQDVLLVNQTADTLQNLCLDFATLGDLKLVERPTIHTLAPHSFLSIKATIKVCFFSPKYQSTYTHICCTGLFDRNRSDLRKHPMGGSGPNRVMRRAERYPYRHHGLHQACVL